jgi:hypothetical protein
LTVRLESDIINKLSLSDRSNCSLITEQQDNPENSNKFSETNVTAMSQPKNSEAEDRGFPLKRVWINQAQSRLPDKSGTGRTFL